MSSVARSRPLQVKGTSLAELAVLLESGEASPSIAHGTEEALVTGITLSSRTVLPGDLYAALPGAKVHGAQFIVEAVQAGAVAVLTDPEGSRLDSALQTERAIGRRVPLWVVDDPRARLGALAARIYGEPGKDVQTWGVTGTNGKTTTTFILDAALNQLGRGPTGLVGTVEIRVGERRLESSGTTPEAPVVHALLALMRESGVRDCSMEVSSHALAQHRVDGLVFDVVGFANLSQDHLDFHPSFEDYFGAKARLFTPEHARQAVICVDDQWGRRLAVECSVPYVRVTSFAPGAPGAPDASDWWVLDSWLEAGLPVARVVGPSGEVLLRSPLPGSFNLANTLLALGMLVAGGVSPRRAAQALAAGGTVPGRMERVTSDLGQAGQAGQAGQTGQPGRAVAPDAASSSASSPGPKGEPLAIVDFAHTPVAVAAALAAVAGTGRPLVLVLGAGGDRDRAKRPLMGEAAALGADVVIVTDDNPRSEDPEQIRAALLAGAARVAAHRPQVEVYEVPGRAEAIAEAVRRAWGEGVVLVAGKGHEQGQDIAGVVHPFDDRSVLRAALRARGAALAGRS